MSPIGFLLCVGMRTRVDDENSGPVPLKREVFVFKELDKTSVFSYDGV